MRNYGGESHEASFFLPRISEKNLKWIISSRKWLDSAPNLFLYFSLFHLCPTVQFRILGIILNFFILLILPSLISQQTWLLHLQVYPKSFCCFLLLLPGWLRQLVALNSCRGSWFLPRPPSSRSSRRHSDPSSITPHSNPFQCFSSFKIGLFAMTFEAVCGLPHCPKSCSFFAPCPPAPRSPLHFRAVPDIVQPPPFPDHLT